MREKIGDKSFRIITIAFGVVLSVFIVALLLGVVTHTTPQALFSSLGSPEIRFAIRLSLMTSIASTAICIIIGTRRICHGPVFFSREKHYQHDH
jgi:molybdate transport system permease protein